MLKTNTFLKTAFIVGMFLLPIASFAGSSGYYGEGNYDTSSGWGGDTVSYGYDYAPSYYDTSSGWGGDTVSYGYDYAPSYYSSGYSTPSYGGGYYGGSSYGGSTLGGYSYVPSYGSFSYGSTYSGPSYGASSIPSSSYSSSNPSVNTVATGGNATASASSSNTNINNNVNNVYVYTTPTGNAVTYNPQYQRLDGYCVITPSNPRVGQTVTATAYMTGGIGDYTYTWGGDLTTSAYGVSTSFTSYSAGTKNITVTARSGQDVITKNCTVTFNGYTSYYDYNSYNYGNYGTTVTTGSPVSGVFIQPGQINKVSTGSSISGVYLNDLPATGMDFGWMEYTIAFMVVVLASVVFAVSKAKKSFVYSSQE